MASDAQVISLYQRTCQDSVVIRRYTGTGDMRTPADLTVRCKMIGVEATQMIGGVMQYRFKAIVPVLDLTNQGFELPITSNDKVVYEDRELGILFPDNGTRRNGNTLIAYEILAQGR